MKKKYPQLASGQDKNAQLAKKIRVAAKKCELTADELQGMQVDVQKFGDGVLLGRLIELLKVLLPIFLPSDAAVSASANVSEWKTTLKKLLKFVQMILPVLIDFLEEDPV